MITVSSKDNPQVKNAVKLKKSAKYRRETGSFLAEGIRICTDAMLSKAEIPLLFVTAKAVEKNREAFKSLSGYAQKTIEVTDDIFALISDTKSPQGFLCVIKALDKNSHFDTIKNGGKFLALDNLQDPNNLGTVLRSAEAFGVDGVIMSADCCDVYNPKVVRGSMGAVFRLPVKIVPSLKAYFSENPEINTYAAVLDNAEKVTQTSFAEPCVVVIGNEGNGISAETLSVCKKRITIPMNGKAESLNASVAAAILIWEMVK